MQAPVHAWFRQQAVEGAAVLAVCSALSCRDRGTSAATTELLACAAARHSRVHGGGVAVVFVPWALE